MEQTRRQPSRRVTSQAKGGSKKTRAANDFPTGTKSVVKRRAQVVAPLMVDLVKLEMASLLRYKNFFRLNARPNCTKKDLIGIVMKHFSAHPRLRDAEVISDFLFRNQFYQKSLGQLPQ